MLAKGLPSTAPVLPPEDHKDDDMLPLENIPVEYLTGIDTGLDDMKNSKEANRLVTEFKKIKKSRLYFLTQMRAT